MNGGIGDCVDNIFIKIDKNKYTPYKVMNVLTDHYSLFVTIEIKKSVSKDKITKLILIIIN